MVGLPGLDTVRFPAERLPSQLGGGTRAACSGRERDPGALRQAAAAGGNDHTHGGRVHPTAPRKSSSPTLFLGIRVGGEDGLKSLNTSREIRSMGLPAEVKLERLEAQKRIPVPLVRVESVAGTPARIEPIGPTGRVEGGWLDDVDHQSLQSAGLEAPDSHHTQLALAWAQELQPGHYRLSMQILKPDDRLAATQAELLVAYVNKSK